MTNRITIEPHVDGYAIRNAETGLVRNTHGEALVYATADLAAYYAETIQRALSPTLRTA